MNSKKLQKILGVASVVACSLILFAGCQKKDPNMVDLDPGQDEPPVVHLDSDVIKLDDNTEADEEEEDIEEVKEGFYRSELSNEWIDESLKDQRPIAVMVDNELTALDHYGVNQADVVYELMNSTENGRITRLMVLIKDWEKVEQLGSIRSTRTTNVMLSGEWNAILVHDGGPFYIDNYISMPYCNNLSGGFARYSNGKASEFTEYVTYDTYTNPTTGKSYGGLKQRLESAKYSTTYTNLYEGPHWQFAKGDNKLAKDEKAIEDITKVSLPFPHNKSELHYNKDEKVYEYYEYGKPHVDAGDNNKVTSFKNVILECISFTQLDQNGYLTYNVTDSTSHEGYYISNGVAVPITWTKATPEGITRYYYKSTGEEIKLNTGKTYIAFVPADAWTNLVLE